MTDQMPPQATNQNPFAEQKSKVFEEANPRIIRCPDRGTPPILGFLQLCADRRFHTCIQEKFQDDAGLNSPEDYWIHADAGGTPKMAHLTTAPDYCYHKMEVEFMGWAAHGDICGGFPPGTPDGEIYQALLVVAEDKVKIYPEATHFVYFAALRKEGDAEEPVVYCLKHEKGAEPGDAER